MDGRVRVRGTDDLRGAEGEQDTHTLAHDRAIRGAVVKAGRLELGLAIPFCFWFCFVFGFVSCCSQISFCFLFLGVLFLRTHDLQLGEDLRCLLCGAADHGQAACTRARTREKRFDSCMIRWISESP